MKSFFYISSLIIAVFITTISTVLAQGVDSEIARVENSEFNFSLETEGSKVLLSWDVENKNDVKSFLIERSYDNKYFVPIYQTYYLKGSSDYIDYLLGRELQQEALYYKLIVEYKNGEEIETEAKEINLLEGKNLKPTIYTNPGLIEFDYTTQTMGKVNLQVFNTTGTLVHDRVLFAQRGNNQESLNIYDLRNGMYFLRLQQNEVVTTTKFYIR